MLSDSVLVSMREAGGLKVKKFEDGNLHFDVNYKVIEEQFPAYMDEMLQATIHPVDWEFYQSGMISYTISDEGNLLWKPTEKWRKMVQ